MYKSWTPTEPNATGLFLEPYNAGFSYQGTGDFRDYKWDTYSLLFDGVDEYVGFGDITAMNGATTLTMSAWIKRDASNARVAIQKDLDASNRLGINVYDDGNIYVSVAEGASYSGGSFASNDTNWHHVALVFDGSGTGNAGRLKGYLDGVEQTLVFIGTVPAATDDNSAAFIIGHDVTNNKWTDGTVDEVAIWNSALSAAQVLAIYNGGTPESLAPYSPEHWWRMGDLVGGVGGLVTDAVATDSNALYLPGSALNYASVPDAADLDGFGDFTLQVDDVTLPDWTPATFQGFLNKYHTTGGQRAFRFQLTTAGTLQLVITTDGTTQLTYTSVATGLSAGATASVRVLRTGSDIKFYVDSGSGFTLLTTSAGVSTTLFDSTAELQVGMGHNGSVDPLAGSIGRARIWSDATQTTNVLDINFALANKGVSSFTATSDQTVTIHTTDIDDPAVIRAETDGVLVNEPTFTADTP